MKIFLAIVLLVSLSANGFYFVRTLNTSNVIKANLFGRDSVDGNLSSVQSPELFDSAIDTRISEGLMEIIRFGIDSQEIDVLSLREAIESLGIQPFLSRAIINAILIERYSPLLANALVADSDEEYWTRRNSYNGGDSYSEVSRTMLKILDEIDEVYIDDKSEFDIKSITLKYGAIPIEKALEMEESTWDYIKAHQGLLVDLNLNENLSQEEIGKQATDLNKHLEESIEIHARKILSDDEFREWQLRHSVSAQEVMREVESVDLDFDTYQKLVDLRVSFDSLYRYASDDVVLQRNERIAWLSYLGESASVMGEDYGREFLKRNSPLYSSISGVLGDTVGLESVRVFVAITEAMESVAAIEKSGAQTDYKSHVVADLSSILGDRADVVVSDQKIAQELQTISSILNTKH